MTDETVMGFEERISYKLRSLYLKYGYLPYKMGKFEEYELYIRNKEFLVSDRVIAFNDTNGKLMALKPDVTLSIIKNGEDEKGVKQKVFYNENVYRVSETTHTFREIMQTGLECIGDVDLYDACEVVSLAAESLSGISDGFCIEISDLDLVVSAINSVCPNPRFVSGAVECIKKKNAHDLCRLCEEYGVDNGGYEKLSCFVSVYGQRCKVLSRLSKTFTEKELEGLKALSEALEGSPVSDKIIFDFSVVNDMNYYNGFVYRGFVDGVNRAVLAGGQYDKMMKKMNRSSGAVGFAVYLDRMEELFRDTNAYDVDILLLYDEKTSVNEVKKLVEEKVKGGFSVSAQKSVPAKLRFNQTVDLRKKDKDA